MGEEKRRMEKEKLEHKERAAKQEYETTLGQMRTQQKDVEELIKCREAQKQQLQKESQELQECHAQDMVHFEEEHIQALKRVDGQTEQYKKEIEDLQAQRAEELRRKAEED